jgi:hypothetical protein
MRTRSITRIGQTALRDADVVQVTVDKITAASACGASSDENANLQWTFPPRSDTRGHGRAHRPSGGTASILPSSVGTGTVISTSVGTATVVSTSVGTAAVISTSSLVFVHAPIITWWTKPG